MEDLERLVLKFYLKITIIHINSIEMVLSIISYYNLNKKKRTIFKLGKLRKNII